jgi:hypothetical protein
MAIKDNNMVPFQVQSIIDNMLNPKDNVHLRGNYRFRLESIRTAIDTAIRKYDNESFLATSTEKSKKKRA